MKSAFTALAAVLCLASVNAFASANESASLNTYKASAYTCAQIQQIVQNEGAVYLAGGLFGSQLVQSSCNASNAGGDGQTAVSEIMATSDTGSCVVGLSCLDNGGN